MEPLKILIAEDDKDDLEFLKFLFERHPSFEVLRTISDGEEICKEILERGTRPRILLTDNYMPKLTGTKAVQLLSVAGVLQKTAVIVLSGGESDSEQSEIESLPGIHFLKKPSNLTEINDLPEKILDLLSYGNVNRI
ncbi:response regulator [Flavobacterium sp.]|uniref:response regulator n=1 Tax=Flavobacterium sp. TaxID=239 RepID=UPI001211A110|nr:response regulator [Flavobacterium sp.]RZJ73048.1 MAG: response regulator [Flavobacterium sp.]